MFLSAFSHPIVALTAPQLLTACEREFGLAMPHVALDEVKSIDDAVSYWEARFVSIQEAEEAAKKHYTVAAPPNVFIAGAGRGDALREWLQQHGTSPDYHGHAEDLDDRLAEEDDEYGYEEEEETERKR